MGGWQLSWGLRKGWIWLGGQRGERNSAKGMAKGTQFARGTGTLEWAVLRWLSVTNL